MKNELQFYVQYVLDEITKESKNYPKMWTRDTIRILNEILKRIN